MTWQAASLVLLAIALACGFGWYERERPPARVVAVVAALAALAVVGRLAFAAFPNVKPTTDIVLFAGFALGAIPGFAVGAVTAIVSNIFLSQGPWTVWQMAGWGAVGVSGALLARFLRGREPSRWTLAVICGLAGLAFGAWMDVYQWTLAARQDLDTYVAVAGTSLPYNLAHAAGNVVFCLLIGPAFLRALARYRRRLEVRWERTPAPVALGVVAVALLLLVPAAAGAATPAQKATAYLVKAQNKDGGFGATAVAPDARPETPASAPVLDWLARFGRGAAGDASGSADALDALDGADAAGRRGARELRGLAGRDGADAAGATEASDAAALAREAAADLGTAEFALPAEAHAARGAEPGSASPAGAGRVDAALPAAAAAATPDTAPTAAAAPVEIPLPTPPTSPDFPAALALRLTTLATDGVQQASLQLNPADMGPIAVQIVVDGSQAQIDFSAAHAQTREALAASLPALAASLHAAGLTLTGGGVSDQRPGAQDGTPASRGEGGLRGPGEEGTDAALAGAAALPRAAQRGLLDLYA